MKKIFLLMVASLFSASLYAGNFTLKSDALKGQLTTKEVFNGKACNGEGQNISPDLYWSDAPSGTKSFAITMYDPDAPSGSGWWHWLVFDIPANTTKLPSGFGSKDVKGIVQSITDFGSYGFGGACPPKGDKAHRYVFTIYALDVANLGLPASSNPALVGFVINMHTIAKASIISYYKR